MPSLSPAASAAGGHSTALPPKSSLAALIPPLRLVSRWNVRRGTTPGAVGHQPVPLPPPVRPGDSAGADPVFGRVAHTFADPTGCHVLLSARNGELYYLHSTATEARKLDGFGPGADGMPSGFRPGSCLASAGNGEAGVPTVQSGVTPGSYVTAVGWDRDRGTEGSTKRILLGTSFGELYEYSLVSPNAASPSKSKSPFDAKAGDLGAMTDDAGDNEPLEYPVLLHRLHATTDGHGRTIPGHDGGAVGGILFQRVVGRGAAGYVVVLASTGGLHRRTRLHTFRSEPSSSSASNTSNNVGGVALPSSLMLRSAFLRTTVTATTTNTSSFSNPSFVEMPGSIDFPELRSCNEGFALRTETGIYYGTMDGLSGGGNGGIADAGMLTYVSLSQENSQTQQQRDGGRMASTVPSSIGLTPHHFVTSNTNDVRFVSRVAKKVIQEERVDWLSVSQVSAIDSTSAEDALQQHGGGAAELITDVRRPDQIWLRKGRSLVHISSSCEDRDVWKFTLARCIETVPTVPRRAGNSSAQHDAGAVDNLLLTSEEKMLDSQFEHASMLCSNSAQKAVVTAARAEYHLSQNRPTLAAKYMAQMKDEQMPFADTALRLALPMLGKGFSEGYCHSKSPNANEALASSNMALITFLNDKMLGVKSKKEGSSMILTTILGTWLTELHLQERERDTKDAGGQRKHQPRNGPPVNHALLHQFLSSFVRDMDPTTIIQVLASHDIRAGDCAGYSAAAGDIDAAIHAALSGDDEKNGALDALRVLNDSPIETAEPFYYKYALTLLSRAPMAAAKSFVARYTEGLSDTKLLPAFMHYDRATAKAFEERGDSGARNASSATFADDENASIRYMEGVIKLGSQSRAIYNYLTSLYANMEDEGPLFRFLSTHVPPASASISSSPLGSASRDSVSELLLRQADEERKCPLDKAYALRTILRTGRHFRSAVKLYMGFSGMRQQAVELALKVDPSLARELARQSEDKDEMKRLWLMIARSAAANGGASSSSDGKDIVARVVMVLKDCGPEILSIEDVLPFLPDFAQIDQFKDEICDALASYSSKIEHYLKEMNDCDQACDAIREELSHLKTMGTQVRSDARCAFTNKLVLHEGEPFYAFPSGYVVLESALKKAVVPHLNEKQLTRLKFIENELARVHNRAQASSRSVRSSYELAKDDYDTEELQTELDGLIAAECPLTGSVMVDSIDKGFSDDEE